MESCNQDMCMLSGISAYHSPSYYSADERKKNTSELKHDIEYVIKIVSHAQQLSMELQQYTEECYAKNFGVVNNKLEEVFGALAYIKAYLDYRVQE